MAGEAGGRRELAWPDPWAVSVFTVGLVVLAAIRTTLLPGLGYWDTGEAQTVPPLLGTMHPTGFPAYVLLGWLASFVLAPLGEPAFRMNLLSAILVAVAAGGTVLVARRLDVPAPVAAAGGLGLGLTPIAWAIGDSADAHALHLALLVVLVLLLLGWERRARAGSGDPDAEGDPRAARADRWLVGAAAVFGAMLANHTLALLLIPAVGLYVLAVEPRALRRRRLVLAALGACVGVAALLYLELPLRAGILRGPLVYGRPDTLDGFAYIVLAEQFRGSFVNPLGDLGGKAADLVALVEAQFGALAILLPAGFLATARFAPRYALLSGLATAITCFFAASYQNADIGRYYLAPAFFAWTWLAVLGGLVADALADGLPFLATGAGDPDAPPTRVAVVRAAVPALLLGGALLLPTAAVLPDRQRTLDRSRETSAADWMRDAYRTFEPDAVVVSWWSYSTPLWYGQLVEGRRPDVRVIDDRTRLDEQLGEVSDVIDANLGQRPVYLIRVSEQETQALAARYVLEPVNLAGGVVRVAGRQEAGR